MAEQRRYGDLALIGRLAWHARPYWFHVLLLGVIGLLATPAALLAPIPLKIAVDSVLGNEPVPGLLAGLVPAGADRTPVLLLLVAVLMIGVALMRNVQALAQWLLSAFTGAKLVLRFRSELFAHVQRLSLTYHDTKGGGDSIYRIQYDAPAIQHVLVDGLLPLVAAMATLLGILVVTASLDAELGLVALAVAPVLLVVSRLYSRPLRRGWVRVHDLQSSALSVLQEVLGALRVVRAFGQEDREHGRFVLRSSEAVGAQMRVILTEGALMLAVGLTIAGGSALVLFIGVSHVQAGRLSLGELLVVMAYLAQIYEPLKVITGKTADLQSSLAGAERAFRLLDERPDVVERPHALPLRRAWGQIEVRNLSFEYEPGRPVLRDVNLLVKAGAKVGISGTTGAGKSTLVNLLCRFHDPMNGDILLDGIDLRHYRLADLRAQFSMVLQEPVLFPTTIAENIAYARPGATMGEIEDAARAAHADAFIGQLSNGYQTLVGERGMRLSGGERQRISLARAFLRDAPIIILDEPTSSVDTETELQIMESMSRLMQGRTTFMIAHRLSTLAACDQRLVIDRGNVRDWIPGKDDDILQPAPASEPVNGIQPSRVQGGVPAGQGTPAMFVGHGWTPRS